MVRNASRRDSRAVSFLAWTAALGAAYRYGRAPGLVSGSWFSLLLWRRARWRAAQVLILEGLEGTQQCARV